MEIDSMEAGPELDAQIAEEVMGSEAKIFSAPDVRDPLRCHVRDANGEWATFEPSTDWSAAGEVLKRMQKLGWTYFQLEYHRSIAWCAEFQRRAESGFGTYCAFSQPTGPLAICLAALKAVRAQESSGEPSTPQ